MAGGRCVEGCHVNSSRVFPIDYLDEFILAKQICTGNEHASVSSTKFFFSKFRFDRIISGKLLKWNGSGVTLEHLRSALSGTCIRDPLWFMSKHFFFIYLLFVVMELIILLGSFLSFVFFFGLNRFSATFSRGLSPKLIDTEFHLIKLASDVCLDVSSFRFSPSSFSFPSFLTRLGSRYIHL